MRSRSAAVSLSLSFALTASLFGCGSSIDIPMNAPDASADGGGDAGGPCEAGAAETTTCGKCGTHTRVCNGDGSWSDFSACAGESGACLPGASSSSPCGRCGTRLDTCTDACAWTTGTCAGEGVCDPDATRTSTDGCVSGQEKTQTCSASCAWKDTTLCAAVKCATPGATETAPCGKCGSGTHLRVCNANGTYSDWSICSGETGACDAGEKRQVACGSCGLGKRDDTCDATCGWALGTCSGEQCAAGALQSAQNGCAAGEEQTRTCSATTCTWGAFGPCQSATPTGWRAMAPPPTGFAGRAEHAAVWTGSSMIVYGGTASSSTYFADAAAYVPGVGATLGAWTTLPAPPLKARARAIAVWTGSVMVVWGGIDGTTAYNDGAIYDPSSSSTPWRTIPAAPIVGRSAYGVWSAATNELVVWGGSNSGATAVYADGAAYKLGPTPGWRTLATKPAARDRFGVAVAGGQMVIFGGSSTGTSPKFDDAFSYDPGTNAWTALAAPGLDVRAYVTGVTTPGGATFWGGWGLDGNERSNGATWDGGKWVAIAAPPTTVTATPGRDSYAGWWSNGKLWAFGGFDGSGAVGDGIAYAPATATWSAMPAGGPSARFDATVVHTGRDAIVWGGHVNYGAAGLADGKLFRP